jgi:F-type H+-transporting ATPase subunit b
VKSLLHSLMLVAVLAGGAGFAVAQDDAPGAAPAAAPAASAEAAPAAHRKARRKVAKADEADAGKVKGKKARRLSLLKEAEERAAAESAAAAEGKVAVVEQPVAPAAVPHAPTPDAEEQTVDAGVDGGIDTVPAVAAIHEPAHEEQALPAGEGAHGAEHGEHGKADGAHGEAGEHQGGHDAEHGGFKVGTFILQLVNFGCLLFILIYFGGRAFSKSLRARHEQLKSEVSEAARLRDEAQQKAATQEKRLAELEKEIASLRAVMREEAEREQARLIESAQDRAKRIQEDMRFQLDQQVKEAEMLLRAEVTSASVKLAEELARKAVDTQDERRLAQEFVAGFAGSDSPAGGR